MYLRSLARSCASLSRATRGTPSPSHLARGPCLAAAPQTRWSSHSPMGSPGKMLAKVNVITLKHMHKKGEPITVMTAHDFPSGHVADAAGMDVVLVGDSLAMVAMGMEDTNEILVEEMLLHCRSVSRAVKSAFTIGDLPMGSYEISPSQALGTAIRFIKEGRMQGVKIEGGREMVPTIKALVTAGIPVLGHVGLTPQRQHALGGFRVQGKSSSSAMRILADALAVQRAGCFAVVIEAVPPQVATIITDMLSIPTIGIGAGNGCSGQVLVQSDMIGNFPPGRSLPKFVKKYGNVWSESFKAIEAFRYDVKNRKYPGVEHTYPIAQNELDKLPTTSSSAGAKVLFTYRNTLSVSLTLSVLRRYATTDSNLWALATLTSSRRMGGAEPTGLKRTTIFSWGKPPAAARAAVASRGSVNRTVDAVIVRGRSAESRPSRTGDAGAELSGAPGPPGATAAVVGDGEAAILGGCVCLGRVRL
ncbi:hypothetical protein BT67DRAFT_378854 [Trichocladium antarcticum]|uniref:3-methyl-2-oxobutanoate hydroxymethyltransferase n=1 Tax=Trichocladium antarcticum TaxID=1450529 RepID=A0AAN6ULC3_9PEZI|nr:hypothetical protein BT67DRAFT_378854 [Trichocladium antarcticum]